MVEFYLDWQDGRSNTAFVMSLGLQYLRAVVDSESRFAFLETKREWFLESETTAFDFVYEYYRRYSNYPSEEALGRAQIVLTAAPDTVEYYRQQLIARAAYNAINSRLTALGSAMQSRDMDQAVELLREMLGDTYATRGGYGISTLQDQAQRVLSEYELAKSDPGIQGVTMGYSVVDEVMNGAQPGDLIFLVGRPGVGKTYIMMECMRAAWVRGHPCMLASMEMTPTHLVRRFVSTTAGVDVNCLRRGELSTWSQKLVYETAEGFRNMPPLHLMVGDFRKSVKDIDSMIQEVSPDICYIDSAYMLEPEKKGNRSARWELIGNVAEELKEVAINRGIPLVCTVQFNREVKRGSTKDPDLEHLGGSDVLGQIGSVVLGILWLKGQHRNTRRAVHVLKNREGPLCKFYINYLMSPPNFQYIGLVDEVNKTPDVDLSHMV